MGKNPRHFKMGKGSKKFGKVSSSYIYVKSYAHAESIGLKPNDSMISTVVDQHTGKIVGYSEGHTFSGRDGGWGGTTDVNNLKEYDVYFSNEDIHEEPRRISAVSPQVARIVAENNFNGPYKIYEVKTSRKRVATIKA